MSTATAPNIDRLVVDSWAQPIDGGAFEPGCTICGRQPEVIRVEVTAITDGVSFSDHQTRSAHRCRTHSHERIPQ